MTTTEADLRALLDTEQACLWSDLADALRNAMNGIWSIGAESASMRVVRNVRAIGPIHPDRVHWPLVAGGVYDMLCGFAGVQPIHYDQAEFEETERVMARHVQDRAADVVFSAMTPTRQQMLHYRRAISSRD